ncbi:unnamed protein product [Cylindrotheca closterium]|uniref:CDAN1-interacting nuclease 1 n=1 Tax=Cylindrotheca closterium TaxID=2856 RepID=A0AAD2PVZ9_9STRA|nr:unnamed protein product [Cylindrotheca closterium]
MMIHAVLHFCLLAKLCVSFDSARFLQSRKSPSCTTTLSSSVSSFEKTGITRELQWDPVPTPIPLRKELDLLESGVLMQRGEFCMLHGDRLQEVEDECLKLGMTLPQGLLIRRQLMVSKVVRSSWMLKDRSKLGDIRRKFQDEGWSLLELSEDIDQPPVSILRAIIAERVFRAYPDMRIGDQKRIVRSIISEKDPDKIGKFLTDRELSELQTAKEFDVVGFQISTATPVLWEEALYTYLNEQKINYVSEETLRDAEISFTPDCLILDDCYINGQLIRWMDVKSFYGSGLRENKHFTNSLKKQIGRYETEFGESGAVVFKHGFSSKLQSKFPSTLFLDAGPLVDDMKFKGEDNL